MADGGSNGNLKWVITTLIAIFAGAGTDRLFVEQRLSIMHEQIEDLRAIELAQNAMLSKLEADLRRIDNNQVQNRQIIDQLLKDVDWLKKH